MMRKERDQNDDWDRHAEKVEDDGTHFVFFPLLFTLLSDCRAASLRR